MLLGVTEFALYLIRHCRFIGLLILKPEVSARYVVPNNMRLEPKVHCVGMTVFVGN